MEVIKFFNENSGAIQAISTFLLVGITAFYALQTYKTTRIMLKQVMSEIILKVNVLRTNLLDKNLILKIRKQIKDGTESMYNIRFCLRYSVKNKSAGFGSIEKPSLLIYSGESELLTKIPARVGISGVDVYHHCDSPSEILAIKKLVESEQELNNTIYLKPAEMKNLEEIYCFFIRCKEPSKSALAILDKTENLQFSLQYLDDREKIQTIEIVKANIKVEEN